MEKVCIWPDGTWCYIKDYEAGQMSWMSDDFELVKIPEETEDIEEWVETRIE